MRPFNAYNFMDVVKKIKGFSVVVLTTTPLKEFPKEIREKKPFFFVDLTGESKGKGEDYLAFSKNRGLLTLTLIIEKLEEALEVGEEIDNLIIEDVRPFVEEFGVERVARAMDYLALILERHNIKFYVGVREGCTYMEKFFPGITKIIGSNKEEKAQEQKKEEEKKTEEEKVKLPTTLSKLEKSKK
jgi:hypothetical protein